MLRVCTVRKFWKQFRSDSSCIKRQHIVYIYDKNAHIFESRKKPKPNTEHRIARKKAKEV